MRTIKPPVPADKQAAGAKTLTVRQLDRDASTATTVLDAWLVEQQGEIGAVTAALLLQLRRQVKMHAIDERVQETLAALLTILKTAPGYSCVKGTGILVRLCKTTVGRELSEIPAILGRTSEGRPVVECLAELATDASLHADGSALVECLAELDRTVPRQDRPNAIAPLSVSAADSASAEPAHATSATTGLVFDERFALHKTGSGHPDRSERVLNLFASIKRQGLLDHCRLLVPTPAEDSLILTNHSKAHLERVRSAFQNGRTHLDHPDCMVCAETFDVAKLAVGGFVQAIDRVQRGELRNAFCIVRPGSHHAKYDAAEGFCFFGTIAIGARHLIRQYGLRRVLIVDWDIHHANGTQEAFESDPRVLTCSIHGHPDTIYPKSGYEHERGTAEGEGYVVNVPLEPGCSDAEYRRAFEERIVTAANAFRPQFVLIAAGFDAHELDPLSVLDVRTSTYHWMTRSVMEIADRHCGGKIVSTLEGGYGEGSLPEACAAHLSAMVTA